MKNRFGLYRLIIFKFIPMESVKVINILTMVFMSHQFGFCVLWESASY